jgi:diacylglycerol kinase family enzyme
MRRRFYLIANPGAGSAYSPLVEDTVRRLARAGATIERADPVDLAAARRLAHAAAASGAFDCIIAAGGDGTIRHVAAALLGSATPLGIIPGGTANVLAHEIGLARTPEATSAMLLNGSPIKVACARANGEPFLLMAGAGFDARVVAALDHRRKSRMGKVAYAGPVLGALIRPIDVLSVSIDHRPHEASWVVVANARHYGGRFVLAPRAGVRERGLETILFKARSRAVLVSQLMSLALGRLDARMARSRDVEMHRCAHVTIAASHPVPTQIDGDAFATTPLDIDAGSEEVQVIVPPE